MPGLNQLKKFSEDIKNVGDEKKIRAQRGEKPVSIPVPEEIPEKDDSDDFLLGMPEIKKEEPKIENDETAAVDADSPADVPDIDSILTPGETGGEAPDLSDFLSDENPSPENSADENEKNESSETSLEDLDLDDLLNSIPDSSGADDNAEDSASPKNPENDAENVSKNGTSDEKSSQPENSDDFNLDELGNFDDLDFSPSENQDEGQKLDSISAVQEPFDDASIHIDDGNEKAEDIVPENVSESSKESKNESSEENQNESPAENQNEKNGSEFNGDAINLNNELQKNLHKKDESNQKTENPDAASPSEAPENSNDDMSVFADGLDELDLGNPENSEPQEQKDSPSDVNPENSKNPETENPAENVSLDNSSLSEADVPDENLSSNQSKNNEEKISPEVFDTSDMDGLNFDDETPKSSGLSENEFPVTGEKSENSDDGFELDDNFSIPGFSDTETADLSKKTPVDTVDFSGKGGRPKNTLTEDEYEQFKKNLTDYPLNLRLAIEDFIAKNEFTDDVVFEIIDKVLKKTPARQVASQLEKIADISISIPRDYEKRSFEQYEAYKQSFQYTLKNRIIPAAVVALVLCFVCFGLFKAAQKFIYEPVMATINYKQGYVLLDNNEFPQSEDKFAEAVSHKAIKKWFFKFADGYRAKKQYERAASIYKNALAIFNHDLQAGLQYAEMELYDRANYERAEEIVRRDILDYHINNPDGLLLLGDVFLEWASVDDSKYELAKNQYVELLQRYGQDNLLYLSRMLRYYIRTDKLREVLNLKNAFYPNIKSLSSDDWTELSGYLLDKLYGTLSKDDEYLRSSIEDVRSMLEYAVTTNSENPVAHYNLARYFVNTNYIEQAKSELEKTLDLFDSAKIRAKKDIYREINASRILGEIYAGNREYLKAREVYTHGADLYNGEHESTGFDGDENTGKLFADLGDIDYFVSGELDSALYNYKKSTEIKNDTPSVNYRIGAIYYGKEDYDDALASFLKVHENEPKDTNVLLSLGNTLVLRGDNFAAQSYYKDLLSKLDTERNKRKILLPQKDAEAQNIVDLYLKANNNLGVALYRTARQTGNSQENAEAMVRFADSMKAWDALTRNPDTMVRMEGGNLAQQNSKYVTHSFPDFEPAIYTEIPKVMEDEKALE